MANEDANSLELLQTLKTDVFDGSDENLAIALGRPTAEIEEWFDNSEQIDEDAREKINALAQERLSA